MKHLHNVFVPDYTETEHWYKHVDTGVRLPSVTTISSIIKKPWLEQWKLREGIKYLIDNHGHSISHKDFNLAIQAAAQASNKKSEEALTVGSAVHDTIEKYLDEWLLNREQPEKDLIHYYEPDYVIDEATHLKYDLTQTQIIAGLRSAQRLFEDVGTFEPVAVEICVGDVDKKYAGKLDLLCKVDGKLEIWDWKTSAQIPMDQSDYPVQINAYRKAFEKMSGETVHKQRIVQLSKSEDKFTMYEVKKSNDLLKAFYALAEYYDKAIKETGTYYSAVHKHA